MFHYLPSAIDYALDTLYEPNAVFSQFLGSASMTIFSLFLSFPLFVLSFLAFLVFYFLSFPFSLFRFLVFSLYLFFLCFLFPIDLRLSCVCVVIGTTCNIYVVVFLGRQAV